MTTIKLAHHALLGFGRACVKRNPRSAKRLLLAREKREFNKIVDLNPRERGNIVRFYKGNLKALANVVLPGDLEGLIRLSLRSSISGSPTDANRSKRDKGVWRRMS